MRKLRNGDDTFHTFDGTVNGAPPRATYHLYMRVYHLRSPDNARLTSETAIFPLLLHYSGARPKADIQLLSWSA